MNETIAWQLSDGTDGLTLAGTTDAIAQFRVNGQPLVQVRTAMRRAAAQPKNRGNLATRVSFLVTFEECASVAAAKQAIGTKTAALLAKLPTHALLEGVFGAVTWQLSAAALESYEFSYKGVTVYGRFDFLGGEFTAETAP